MVSAVVDEQLKISEVLVGELKVVVVAGPEHVELPGTLVARSRWHLWTRVKDEDRLGPIGAPEDLKISILGQRTHREVAAAE